MSQIQIDGYIIYILFINNRNDGVCKLENYIFCKCQYGMPHKIEMHIAYAIFINMNYSIKYFREWKCSTTWIVLQLSGFCHFTFSTKTVVIVVIITLMGIDVGRYGDMDRAREMKKKMSILIEFMSHHHKIRSNHLWFNKYRPSNQIRICQNQWNSNIGIGIIVVKYVLYFMKIDVWHVRVRVRALAKSVIATNNK